MGVLIRKIERYNLHSVEEGYKEFNKACIKAKEVYNELNFALRRYHTVFETALTTERLLEIINETIKNSSKCNQIPIEALERITVITVGSWNKYYRTVKKFKDSGGDGEIPSRPKYLEADERFVYNIRSGLRIENDRLIFPEEFNDFSIPLLGVEKVEAVIIIPKIQRLLFEIKTVREAPEIMLDNGRYMGIDMGVHKCAAVSSNVYMKPFVISGDALKKIVEEFQVAKQSEGKNNLYNREIVYRKVLEYIYKVSEYIVDQARINNISCIVIGYNKKIYEKQYTNTLFNIHHLFPHEVLLFPRELIQRISGLALNYGIKVRVTDEHYTSGTSFLDREDPIFENYNRNRNIKGTFYCNNGLKVDADINASLQMIKKVYPNAFKHRTQKELRRCSSNPEYAEII